MFDLLRSDLFLLFRLLFVWIYAIWLNTKYIIFPSSQCAAEQQNVMASERKNIVHLNAHVHRNNQFWINYNLLLFLSCFSFFGKRINEKNGHRANSLITRNQRAKCYFSGRESFFFLSRLCITFASTSCTASHTHYFSQNTKSSNSIRLAII